MSEIREQDFFSRDRVPGETDEGKDIEVLITSEYMKPAMLWLPYKDKDTDGPWYAVDDNGWSIPLDRCSWRYVRRP